MTAADLSELHACLDSLDRNRLDLADEDLAPGLRSLISAQARDTIAELRAKLPAATLVHNQERTPDERVTALRGSLPVRLVVR